MTVRARRDSCVDRSIELAVGDVHREEVALASALATDRPARVAGQALVGVAVQVTATRRARVGLRFGFGHGAGPSLFGRRGISVPTLRTIAAIAAHGRDSCLSQLANPRTTVRGHPLALMQLDRISIPIDMLIRHGRGRSGSGRRGRSGSGRRSSVRVRVRAARSVRAVSRVRARGLSGSGWRGRSRRRRRSGRRSSVRVRRRHHRPLAGDATPPHIDGHRLIAG